MSDNELIQKKWTEEEAIAALQRSEGRDEIIPGLRAQAQGQKVFVESDFATLKGAFMGNPYSFYVPDPYFPTTYQGFRGMPKQTLEWYAKNRGKPFREADPELWEAMVTEMTGLRKALENNGVHIIQNDKDNIPPEILNYVTGWAGPSNKNYNFTAQGMLEVVGNCIVDCHETFPLSRYGTLEYTEALIGLIENDPEAVWLTAPPPIPVVEGGGPGPFITPGDFRIFPNKLLVIGLGVFNKADIENPKAIRSSANELGVEILRRMLKPYGWRVETVYFDANVSYHIDAVIAQITEGIIGYGKNILFTSLPRELDDWEVIELSEEDYRVGGGNTICLGRNRVIVEAAATGLIEKIDSRGVEVIPVKLTSVYKATGSGIHCSHARYWAENS